MTLVEQIVNRYKGLPGQKDFLIVFDVDSTLMNTEPRNRAILEESARTFSFVGEYLSSLQNIPLGWNFLAPLEEAGLRDREKLQKIRHFWEKRFFTDDYVIKDRPYPGAREILHSLKTEGFRLIYLTGRHMNGMSEGTKKSFLNAGFPAGEEETFLFKPRFEMEDKRFKEEACRTIASRGTVAATFDNEPANCNLLLKAFPEALHFWLDTITSPEPEILNEKVRPIKGFLE
ncbi:MAG: HAD hydrolase-like protein [Spirochaetales bacterium]|nr:HAD hydrolase-like protein [Spirochaetales bacterium]